MSDKSQTTAWITPLAEQLVTSLRGVGGNANTYEANVAWTAAMISSRAPDGHGELVKRLAAIEERLRQFVADECVWEFTTSWRAQLLGMADDIAALAQLPAELRGKP